MANIIRITAKRDGFRRCGMAHPGKAVEYTADRFTEDQLTILKAEPMLVVEEVEVEDTPTDPPPAPGTNPPASEGNGGGKNGGNTDPTPENPSRPTEAGEALAAIKAAIAGLDRADEKLWTNDGKPQVAAIEAVLRWNITAAERNEAWTAIEAEANAGAGGTE